MVLQIPLLQYIWEIKELNLTEQILYQSRWYIDGRIAIQPLHIKTKGKNNGNE